MNEINSKSDIKLTNAEDYQIPVLCNRCPRFNQKWEYVGELCILCNGTKYEKEIINENTKN